jgi:primary-amine oxidase
VFVSITDKKVVSMTTAPPNAQPMITGDEMAECEAAVIADPQFKALLEKHYGIDDTSLVMVDIWSAGYYGQAEEKTMRLTRPLCFLRSFPGDNGYAHPIEGIRPVVDLNNMKVYSS